jgi:16S rRNA (cytidine1402-2'-O)-methyltransferase
MSPESGCLTLVATPIGNLSDLAPRAIQALREADFWIVEDSRISGKLGFHLETKKPMKVLNEHTSLGQITRYVEEIRAGASAALLTDGGCPAISDPGAIITNLCHDKGIPVLGIPGPSAPVLALMVSGFFAQRFAFLGFLGRKAGAIRGELSGYVDSPLTLVLFESPHRLDALIKVAHEALGARRFVVARELTKVHEQVFRGVLPFLPDETMLPRKGEITVVIEGRRKGSDTEPMKIANEDEEADGDEC